MRVVKGLFVLVFLVALVAGAAYGYYWFQIKSYIDQQIAQASSQVLIAYDQLIVDPRGEIRLEGLDVQPLAADATYPIQRIIVRSDDPLFFFDAQGRVDRGEWPGFLAFSMEGLELNFDGALSALAPSPQVAFAQTDLDALACGEVQTFGLSEYQAMGIRSTRVDLAITAEINDARGTMNANVDMDFSGIGHLEFGLDLGYASGLLRPSTAMAANPRMNRLRFAYQDLGLNNKKERFCSERLGVTPEEYRVQHLQAVRERVAQLGMTVPEVLFTAYRDATEKGARAEVILSPPGGLGTEAMMGLGAPNEMIDRLGLRLLVNAKPVDLNTVDWAGLLPDPERGTGVELVESPLLSEAEQASEGVIEPATESESVLETAQSQTSIAQNGATEEATEAPVVQPMDDRLAGIAAREAQPEPKRFQSTGFSELAQYVDSDIRIRTYFGNRVEGRIKSVEGSRLVIEHRIDQGLAIYPVDRDKLETIEVFR